MRTDYMPLLERMINEGARTSMDDTGDFEQRIRVIRQTPDKRNMTKYAAAVVKRVPETICFPIRSKLKNFKTAMWMEYELNRCFVGALFMAPDPGSTKMIGGISNIDGPVYFPAFHAVFDMDEEASLMRVQIAEVMPGSKNPEAIQTARMSMMLLWNIATEEIY